MSQSRLESIRLWFLAVFLPLAGLWEAAARIRTRFAPKPYHSKLAVLSVGNIHSGGTGKTPTVLALAESLAHRRPVVLSRGYRGRAGEDGAWVDQTASDGAALYGDEPWMMAARSAKVYVDRDRVRAAKAIETSETGLILLDDGFQHLALGRDVDLVLLPDHEGPESAFCLPFGDLREPLDALERASAFLLPGLKNPWAGWLQDRFPGTPRFACEKKSEALSFSGRKFGAFCGIADPESFRRQLASVGEPAFFEPFADHYVYRESDLERLSAKAPDLVTTEKDWHKLPGKWKGRVSVLRIRMELSAECLQWVEKKLEARA